MEGKINTNFNIVIYQLYIHMSPTPFSEGAALAPL